MDQTSLGSTSKSGQSIPQTAATTSSRKSPPKINTQQKPDESEHLAKALKSSDDIMQEIASLLYANTPRGTHAHIHGLLGDFVEATYFNAEDHSQSIIKRERKLMDETIEAVANDRLKQKLKANPEVEVQLVEALTKKQQAEKELLSIQKRIAEAQYKETEAKKAQEVAKQRENEALAQTLIAESIQEAAKQSAEKSEEKAAKEEKRANEAELKANQVEIQANQKIKEAQRKTEKAENTARESQKEQEEAEAIAKAQHQTVQDLRKEQEELRLKMEAEVRKADLRSSEQKAIDLSAQNSKDLSHAIISFTSAFIRDYQSICDEYQKNPMDKTNISRVRNIIPTLKFIIKIGISMRDPALTNPPKEYDIKEQIKMVKKSFEKTLREVSTLAQTIPQEADYVPELKTKFENNNNLTLSDLNDTTLLCLKQTFTTIKCIFFDLIKRRKLSEHEKKLVVACFKLDKGDDTYTVDKFKNSLRMIEDSIKEFMQVTRDSFNPLAALANSNNPLAALPNLRLS